MLDFFSTSCDAIYSIRHARCHPIAHPTPELAHWTCFPCGTNVDPAGLRLYKWVSIKSVSTLIAIFRDDLSEVGCEAGILRIIFICKEDDEGRGALGTFGFGRTVVFERISARKLVHHGRCICC